MLGDLAAVLTVGLLLLGAVLVPARDGVLRGERLRWTRAARWSALVWAGAVVRSVVLTLSDVLAHAGLRGARPGPAVELRASTSTSVARCSCRRVLALAVGGLRRVWYARRPVPGWSGCSPLAALVPADADGPRGHVDRAHRRGHAASWSTCVGISLWCGGVVALVLLGTSDRRSYPIAVPRFSTLALWCAVAVAASGVVSSVLRLATPSELVTTSYGRLVLLKVAAHRASSPRSASGTAAATCPAWPPSPTRLLFVRVAAVEVLVMAATIGVAVALSRTPPPVPGEVPLDVAVAGAHPARVRPAARAHDRRGLLWDEARLDGFWFTVVVILGALYGVGLRTLRRSGDAWSLGPDDLLVRPAWPCCCSRRNAGLATYSHVMFSAHMVQHMLLSMVIPIFLVLGGAGDARAAHAAAPPGPGRARASGSTRSSTRATSR